MDAGLQQLVAAAVVDRRPVVARVGRRKARADVQVAAAGVQASVAQRDELLVTLTSALEAARAHRVEPRERAGVDRGRDIRRRPSSSWPRRATRRAWAADELADAQTAVTTAEGDLLVTAQWQLADAWVQLRRATGEMSPI